MSSLWMVPLAVGIDRTGIAVGMAATGGDG